MNFPVAFRLSASSIRGTIVAQVSPHDIAKNQSPCQCRLMAQ